MAKTKIETKRVRLNMKKSGDARKLVGLKADGWGIQDEQHDRVYLSGRETGWVTYMMTRAK